MFKLLTEREAVVPYHPHPVVLVHPSSRVFDFPSAYTEVPTKIGKSLLGPKLWDSDSFSSRTIFFLPANHAAGFLYIPFSKEISHLANLFSFPPHQSPHVLNLFLLRMEDHDLLNFSVFGSSLLQALILFS